MYKIINKKAVRRLRKMRFWRRHKTAVAIKARLCVFRSANHIQAQVIDDSSGRVLASANSVESVVRTLNLRGKALAEHVGALVARRAQEAGVDPHVVFDRNGYAYHGRIQVLADSARQAGLQF